MIENGIMILDRDSVRDHFRLVVSFMIEIGIVDFSTISIDIVIFSTRGSPPFGFTILFCS